MTAPEREIMERLLERLDKLQASATLDLTLLEGVPPDFAAFEAMSERRQSAARAFLKSFEQMEDQLSRAFRTATRLLGEDTQRWFSRDHADYMEKAGVFDDAGQWSGVVKLRNQLVHDYPLDPQVQFDRLISAIDYLPLLVETHQRFAAFVRRDVLTRLV